jgi:lamin tail-like protein
MAGSASRRTIRCTEPRLDLAETPSVLQPDTIPPMRLLGVSLVLGLILGPVASAATGSLSLSVSNDGRLEHVEITTTTAMDLSGWMLSSSVGGQSFRFGTVRIVAGQRLRIVSGMTPAASGDIQWTRANVWNNEGDIAMLFDGQGALVTEFAYGRVKAASPAKASSAKGSKAGR